jgi:hypothetical protein
MARHFLYLTNTRLVCLVARRGSIVARREFAVSGARAAPIDPLPATRATEPTSIFQ